ncbi:hypothetical protein BIFGAL_03545 [Bifidobacterium gallicum DSM 20093 = LMG 11596]|uniref:Uncharacterized protein n=1 Tax=Bifidobacterium gallicum DSM 20093 = LMG 11596 TaxID=561180 RepID=D1NUM0_9BIFI|nr:hypothetical protein BIFGAL_03545 [Bifidobacterium gallicum DSM 20093 = LMG 11596]
MTATTVTGCSATTPAMATPGWIPSRCKLHANQVHDNLTVVVLSFN